MTVPTRITSYITILCLCTTLAVAQDTTQTQTTPQPQTNTPQTQTTPQDAKKEAQREAKPDAKSQSATGERVSAGSAEQAVGQLHSEGIQALVRADTATLERMWADDYSFTNPGGNVMNKAGYIGALKSGGLKFETLDITDTQIRVYGDAAVVTGRATVKGKGGNQDINDQIRYTSVYVKRQGQWQGVATQATRISQQQ